MMSLGTFFIMFVCCSFFSLLVITPTLINFMLIGEVVWVGFYNISMYFGIEYASLTYLIYGLLILCLATAESVIGLSLIMFKFILFGSVKFPESNERLKEMAYSNFIP